MVDSLYWILHSYFKKKRQLFYRWLFEKTIRGKSEQHRAAILPNGKVLMKQQIVPQKITAALAVRVKMRGKSSQRNVVIRFGGKPYGLKDQIYRHLRVGSLAVGG